MNKSFKKGFTLIELLAVVFIIGVLASVIIFSLDNAKENSKVSAAVALLGTVKRASELYKFDTKQWPTRNPGNDCRGGGTAPINCNATNDPFLVSNSVANWNGPYIEGGIYNKSHPWGGGVNYFNEGITAGYQTIVLDDDRAGYNSDDDKGGIPISALTKIDKILDDGAPHTGSVTQGYFTTAGVPTYLGEIVYSYLSK